MELWFIDFPYFLKISENLIWFDSLPKFLRQMNPRMDSFGEESLTKIPIIQIISAK